MLSSLGGAHILVGRDRARSDKETQCHEVAAKVSGVGESRRPTGTFSGEAGWGEASEE